MMALYFIGVMYKAIDACVMGLARTKLLLKFVFFRVFFWGFVAAPPPPPRSWALGVFPLLSEILK